MAKPDPPAIRPARRGTPNRLASPRDPAGEDSEALDDPAAAAPPAPAPRGWIEELRAAPGLGFHRPLGGHSLVFIDRGSDTLVVSFDNLSSVRDPNRDRDPWGYPFVARQGWSHLGVMAFCADWFRDPALLAELTALAEQGFFRRFANVTMIGTSMGGYAACAFAALAPGCRVIAFSPQSTLKKDLVPWEKRFSSGRKADWSGPFADAAAASGAAAQVWLVHDPAMADDARHVARFTGANVHNLRARHGGHKTALFLRRAGLLATVVHEAVAGTLTEARFYRLYRRGRLLPWFLGGLCARLAARGRPGLIGRVVLHAKAQGAGFAAHRLRRKYLSPADDPLRRGRRAGRRATDGGPT